MYTLVLLVCAVMSSLLFAAGLARLKLAAGIPAQAAVTPDRSLAAAQTLPKG